MPDEPMPEGFPERTEAALERALRGGGGDRELFFKLWAFVLNRTRHHPLMGALKRNMEAEDVAQALWLTVFKRGSLNQFTDQGEGSLRAYLSGCVTRHMKDLLRQQAALKRGEGNQPGPLHTGGHSPSEQNLVDPEDAGPGVSTIVGFVEWKGLCNARLEGKECQVWSLRVERGLDFKEIAQMLGVTAESARGYFHRAKKRLEEEGLIGGDER